MLAPGIQEQVHDSAAELGASFGKMDLSILLGMEEMACLILGYQMTTHLELSIVIWVLLDLVKVLVPPVEVSGAFRSANTT